MSQKEQFMSFEQAANKLDEMKKKDVRAEAKKKNRPISAPNPQDMQRFLDYATSLLKDKYPELLTVLRLRYKHGWSCERIAKELGGYKPQMVKELEKTAVKRCKDLIASSKKNKIPIIGG